MKLKRTRFIQVIIIVLVSFIFIFSLYVKYKFDNPQFEQLIYSLKYSNGTSRAIVKHCLIYCTKFSILLAILLLIPTIYCKKQTLFIFNIYNKSIFIKIFPIRKYIKYTLIISFFLLLYSLNSIGVISFLVKNFTKTNIYDNYYVSPDSVKIIFPEQKQNLIYIFIESMESTFSSVYVDNEEVNLIPNLKSIAELNISFSNTKYFGGAVNIYGTDYTIAAIVAQTAGIPLKIKVERNKYENYSSFLPGIISLGDILAKEGYNQYYLLGSPAIFAGRDKYFKQHGNYTIYDYEWAKKENIISDDYFVFWGYEDKKLFEIAKKEISKIAMNKKPFNFTMLTVDNHAVDGYLDETCEVEYDYKYANVLSCNDKMIYDFVIWLTKQSFYENTTIVLVGDHLTMQGDTMKYVDNNNRTIYNAFINSKIQSKKDKNRMFSSMDLFPTTLASLGATIEGDRLGLGTNLFSDKKTLIEELGYNYLNEELSKPSDYYNDKFLKETYIEMLNE